jgi:preprotein translocase subunit YajC
MGFFMSDAVAATSSTQASQQGGMGSIIMIAGLVIAFYLMIWWPQNKRMKEHRKLIANLAKGDEIITSGGLVGRVTKISDDFISVLIAPNVEITIQKGSISALLPKGTFKTQPSLDQDGK